MFGRKPKKAQLVEEEAEPMPQPEPEVQTYDPEPIAQQPVPQQIPRQRPIHQPIKEQHIEPAPKEDDEEYWQKILEDMWVKIDHLYKRDITRFR